MYIVRWLGHHGNRLYCFLGLRSKMWEWSGVNTPKTVMTKGASAVLKTHFLEIDIAAHHTFSILSLACYCFYHYYVIIIILMIIGWAWA